MADNTVRAMTWNIWWRFGPRWEWDPVALTVRVDHPAGPLPIVAACLEYGIPYTDARIAHGYRRPGTPCLRRIRTRL
jgi:hypothetical protein